MIPPLIRSQANASALAANRRQRRVRIPAVSISDTLNAAADTKGGHEYRYESKNESAVGQSWEKPLDSRLCVSALLRRLPFSNSLSAAMGGSVHLLPED